MAVIKRGILGGVQNKIGNVVGSSWKGIAVLKSLPLSVANPQTASQVANRDRFKSCNAFFSSVNAIVIKPLWDRFASQMSGYNAAVQYNVGNFSGTELTNPEQLRISNGKMASTAIASVVADKSLLLASFTWTSGSGTGLKLGTDKPFIVIYNVNKHETIGAALVQERDDEEGDVVLPASWSTGDSLACYLAFRRADGTVVDVSSYSAASIVA